MLDTDIVIDYSHYNDLLFADGKPINDVNFVQSQRAEIASVLGQHVVNNDDFLPPLDDIDEDTAFENWTPKGIQSTDELLTYMDNLNKD